MSRAPGWLELAGGTSADNLYDYEEEAVFREELGESMCDAMKMAKGLLAMRSFCQLPCRPQGRQTP
jgi:hypothetical protein